MAIVAGLNKVYNDIEVRKLKTDLSSIKIGQVVSAKISEKLGDRDVILRLQEGWNFRGELSEDIKDLRDGLLKFKVIGFEDGKLQLQVLNEQGATDVKDIGDLKQLIEASGFSKEDTELIKVLLKHNIPLNKENIDIFKSVMELKSNGSEKSIDEFVAKYLNAKGLTSESENFELIKNSLTSSLKALINMSDEEVFFFIENALQTNEENLQNFNKLFKEEGQLFKEILNLKNNENIVGNKENSISEDKSLILKTLNEPQIEELKSYLKDAIEGNENTIEINNGKDIVPNNKLNNENLLRNLPDELKENLSNEAIKLLEKGAFKTLLKALDGEEASINLLKNLNKDIISKENNQSSVVQENNTIEEGNENKQIDVLNILKNVNNKEELEKSLTSIIKDVPKEKLEKVENLINRIVDGHVTKEETNEFKQLTLKSEDTFKAMTSLNSKESITLKEIISKVFDKEILTQQKPMSGEDIREAIRSKTQEVKEAIRALANGDISKIPNEFMKEAKFFNDVSKEYYYMNVPLNLNEKEYGASIIIKDNRKDGKKIDSKNVKMVVTVDANIMGTVDGYLVLNNENMNITIKAFSPWDKVLNSSREKLSAAISKLGYNVLVNVEEKIENVDISKCNDFFNDYEISVLNTLA
ncbi:hypothetical protein [Clostridium frigidicarnis]|uniref:Hook-length control protein FliK n=1 Tax=Clostridium frigidicarnis TaxID=84698 RepID=A0A1I0YXX9_9CLOT|nr:hypothetical protein [Clostridium frigidicarnis]SFB18269.1 hypothetical protein SAMN04488528_101620 [Clostridium frigidicarnis]